MTNYEFYKDTIIELIINRYSIAVDKRTGKPKKCITLNCDYCKFNNKDLSCIQCREEWLKAEHVEIPKLTKKERLLCELFEYGYIIYNPREDWFVWSSMNAILDECRIEWVTIDKNDDYRMMHILSLDTIPSIKSRDMFSFIKGSGRAWSIAELLELEVIEE